MVRRPGHATLLMPDLQKDIIEHCKMDFYQSVNALAWQVATGTMRAQDASRKLHRLSVCHAIVLRLASWRFSVN